MSQEKKSVVFRVDASNEIGSGHVMRCITLATTLQQHGYKCSFICREKKGDLIELIQSLGFLVFRLQGEENMAAEPDFSFHASWLGCTWQQDALQTGVILEKSRPDWLIVDHYAIDYRWEVELQDHYKKLMVIDDLANKSHNSDLLLDQNLGRNMLSYKDKVPECGELLLGPKYSLLNPIFGQLRKTASIRNSPINRMLIFFGGHDKHELTSMTVDMLLRHSYNKHVDIVLPGPQRQYNYIQDRINNNDKFHLYGELPHLGKVILEADISIGAGGSTCWERCCLGLPAILVSTAHNQIDIAKSLDKVGACKYIGNYNTEMNVEKELSDSLDEFVRDPHCLNNMSTIAHNISDGLGVNRVIDKLMEM